MYRTSGLIVLVLGLALTYSLVFTTFNRPVDRYTFNEAGGFDQISIECPAPVAVLFGDGERQVEHPSEAQLCVLSSRTLFAEGVIVTVLALGLAIGGIVRGRKPHPKPMRVLPVAASDETTD